MKCHLTNDDVKDCFNELYGAWWKKYRDQKISWATLEEAYTTGSEIVNRRGNDLAMSMWLSLMRILQARVAK